jgi:hypothetical protein
MSFNNSKRCTWTREEIKEFLHAFFWVIPRRLNFIYRRFGTLFHLHRRIGVEFYTYPPMKMIILRRLNFICRRFGTLCLFHLHGRVGVEFYTYSPMKMEQCSETSAYKIQTQENYPEERIQYSEHGENLKWKILLLKNVGCQVFKYFTPWKAVPKFCVCRNSNFINNLLSCSEETA